MDCEDPITQFFPGQEDVDLYSVLSLDSSSKLDDIKKAYRRLALIYHPDKHMNSSEETRSDASTRFQQVGFAYAVLVDENRRAKYDKTGRTDEGFELRAGDDGWDAYFADLFDGVTKGKLDDMKKEYQGSNDELEDIKRVYHETDSSIEEIMAHIPHSTYDDEARFIVLVTQLIKDGELPASKSWDKSVKDEKAKLVRKKQGEKEAQEAEELAKELGVWDEFYGSGKEGPRKAKGKGKATKEEEGEDHSALQALMLRKKKDMTGFFDNLAAKYAEPEPKGKAKKGKKRANRGDDDNNGVEVQNTGKRSRGAAPPDIDDKEFDKLQQRLFGDGPKGKDKAEQAGQSQTETRATAKPVKVRKTK